MRLIFFFIHVDLRPGNCWSQCTIPGDEIGACIAFGLSQPLSRLLLLLLLLPRGLPRTRCSDDIFAVSALKLVIHGRNRATSLGAGLVDLRLRVVHNLLRGGSHCCRGQVDSVFGLVFRDRHWRFEHLGFRDLPTENLLLQLLALLFLSIMGSFFIGLFLESLLLKGGKKRTMPVTVVFLHNLGLFSLLFPLNLFLLSQVLVVVFLKDLYSLLSRLL